MKRGANVKYLFIGLVIVAGLFGSVFLWERQFWFIQEVQQQRAQREMAENISKFFQQRIEMSEKLEEDKEDIDLFKYLEVMDSCGPYFEEECLYVRAGPEMDESVVVRLRNGQVLKIGKRLERDDEVWYKVEFDEWLLYPERLRGDWYVSGDGVRTFWDRGPKVEHENFSKENNKRIEVNLSEQRLYAYEGDELFMSGKISGGLASTPTPRGEFRVFKKTPTRYMQGPIPGVTSRYWDFPGVPWNLYFTYQGAIIHGTYWHDNFGIPQSAGCVNMSTDQAKELYHWAPLGTKVTVFY